MIYKKYLLFWRSVSKLTPAQGAQVFFIGVSALKKGERKRI